MLGSCTGTARLLLLAAHDQALEMGHHWLGTEHVILAEIAFEEMEGAGPLIAGRHSDSAR